MRHPIQLEGISDVLGLPLVEVLLITVPSTPPLVLSVQAMKLQQLAAVSVSCCYSSTFCTKHVIRSAQLRLASHRCCNSLKSK